MKLRFGIFLLLLMAAFEMHAQNSLAWTPDRSKIIVPATDSVFLDSLPVMMQSLIITDAQNNPLPLIFEYHSKPFSYIKLQNPVSDTLYLSYKIIDLPLNTTFRHKDTSLILPDIDFRNPNLYEAPASDAAFKPFEGLTSSGSISRGITIGSNQDAVLNSSLNLQLSGNLGQGTEIRASITDNSIPVQADGYTQQLQEFDKVYMELENPDFGLLRAGDYNVNSQENHFLKFDKRISGAGIFTGIPSGENNFPIQLQGGIARGNFARNQFQGQEGNQGPYKLTGNNGEQFIIIISGSERVYIDGILMKRGELYDYVIDYNAGEITFTTLRPITKDRRIVVEFQYTEQNFLRSVVFGQGGFESGNLKTSVQFYNEQDSKNQPLLRENSDEEKRLLSRAGDDLENARASTIFPVNFSNDLVLYRLTDSLGTDSVLVFSVDSTIQLYQASFAFLGPFQGNYVLEQSSANGRVFRWVPPVNGIPQGDYEPVKQLVAPNQLQIITISTEATIAEDHRLLVNLASSKNDINLFSERGEQNDNGAAGKISYRWDKDFKSSQMYSMLHYEFNQSNFKTVERIRNVEFARDWNLPVNFSEGLQLGGIAIGFTKDSAQLEYQADFLNTGEYSGFRNSFNIEVKDKRNIGKLYGSWLTTNDTSGSSDFFRESGFLTHYLTDKLWTGVSSVGEWNQKKGTHLDTLLRSSYNFLQYQLYAGYGDTLNNFTELSYTERYDDTALSGRFVNYSKAVTYALRSQYKTNFNSTANIQVNVRNLEIYEPEPIALERTITTRANYVQRFFGNAITSSTFYEAGSGTEPRRDFSYVEVPAGTGTYTFTDYNSDGLKTLDEFEIAPSPDLAKYVRIFTPSNVYLRTNLVKLGESLNIHAPAKWQNMEDIRSAAYRFSILFNYQLDRKTLLDGNSNDLNPFRKLEDDSLIVALNNNFRSTLFFNRSATKFGADYTFRQTDNRNLLSFGVEQRAISENTLNLRYQPFEVILLKAQASIFDKKNISANFTSRNFQIDQLANKYSISYQPGSYLVLTARYEWDNSKSIGEQKNILLSQTIGADVNYNAAEKLSAQLSINYIKNDFEGNTNTPAGYEMLQSLQPGNNGTWTLTLQRTLKKNILISLNYNGRVSPDIFPIHTGNVEIKAFF